MNADGRYYKNWRIEVGGVGWKLIPRDFYDDADLRRWFNNGYSIEFTTLDSAKKWISNNKSTVMYNEIVSHFEKVRDR